MLKGVGLHLEGIKKPEKAQKQKVPFKRFFGDCPICSVVDGLKESRTLEVGKPQKILVPSSK